VRAAALTVIAIALAFPGATLADALPTGPGPRMSPSPPCNSPQCANAQVPGNGRASANVRSRLLPGENERLADLFLLALLVSFVVIIPMVVLRQRNAQETSGTPSPGRQGIRLVWSRNASRSREGT
jgi:hypothetical protein